MPPGGPVGCGGFAPIVITIPGEMRGKGRPRFSVQGGFAKAYTDAKTANMETWVKACAIGSAPPAPLDGPLELAVDIVVAVAPSWPKRRREDALAGQIFPTNKPDLDNCLKLVADALNGIIWQDDKQLVRMVASKRFGLAPQTVLTISRVPA
jgi:Holliday junction resolvase RusA-like endonuclease